MKRWAFNTCAAVSLVLTIATMSLWLRSHWREDRLGFSAETPLSVTSLRSSRGILYLERLKLKAPEQFTFAGPPRDSWSFKSRPVASWAQPVGPGWDLGSFGFDERPVGTLYRLLQLSFPHWLVMVLSATPLAVWLILGFRKRNLRARVGLCANCGYDLRASPERCPECGAAAAKPSESTLAP